MDGRGRGFSSSASLPEEEMDLKRGPWTMEEDLILINNIANHGEGRWNALARFAGLKRTGKSCRLRWLNYLRPDIRRGNFTPEEQLLILELHSRWGNRWSKIAQHLPGRTDNEIKNYWRTRVQKQAKQLRCDVNSKEFKDAMRYVWMPRLFERIRASNPNAASAFTANMIDSPAAGQPSYGSEVLQFSHSYTTPENSSSNATVSSDSAGATVHAVSPQESDLIDYEQVDIRGTSYTCGGEFHQPDDRRVHVRAESFTSPAAASYYEQTGLDYRAEEASEPLALGGEACAGDYTWSLDDLWFWQQQLSDGF